MISARKEIRGPDVASHYDELDRFYREIWGEHVHHGLWIRGDESRTQAVRQLVELVAREAGVTQGLRVMDIGCGYGATARFLAEEFSAEVTGMTISEAQHRRACALGASQHPTSNSELSAERSSLNPSSLIPHPSPTFLLGDWLANAIPSDSFDAAIAIESSEHMDKPGFFCWGAWRDSAAN